MKIQLDWNYGVHYHVASGSNFGKEGLLTIYLDPIHPDVVAALFVTPNYDYYAIDKETVEKLQKENCPDHRKVKSEKTIYEYFEYSSKDEPLWSTEWIRIIFSRDDLHLTEHPLLIEHLGLEKELEDGILYYKAELLKSETFKYKWLIENGEFANNIAFARNPKYDYPDYEDSFQCCNK